MISLQEPGFQKRAMPLSVKAWHGMIAQGLAPKRAELIRGAIIEKMSKSILHAKLNSRLDAKPKALRRADAFKIAPSVFIDNQASNRFTVIEVNALDRPALLNNLAWALFQSKVTLHSAHIATYGERAVDTFYCTDLLGSKIDSKSKLKALETRLVDAATGGQGADLRQVA